MAVPPARGGAMPLEGDLLTVPDFGAPHAFTTRAWGVSEGPFASLNLGEGTGDEPHRVEANRARLAARLGATVESLSLLRQVHGARVVPASAEDRPEADAQVSNDPALLLVIATADCLPILFFDPDSGAVGAAHCGWRGTVAGLAARTVGALTEQYGARPARLRVAIGPGICGRCYQVGDEVAAAVSALGLDGEALARDEQPGKWRLDLAAVNTLLLERAGVRPESIHATGECTSCRPDRYFSYRRDGGVTGRHWALVAAPGGRRAG